MDKLREYFELVNKPDLTICLNTSVQELQKHADWAKQEYRLPHISLNKVLSRLLIRQPGANQLREIVDLISERIKVVSNEPVQITSIEILFEPSFGLEPLAIFKQLSRNKALLIFWPGEYRDGKLTYAVPVHTHYRSWSDPGVGIVQV